MDVIALHRVVKEDQPNQPIRTRKTVFLQHGDAKDFTGMFLPGTLSATTPDDFGAAVYWARHDVDVWGVDKQARDLGDAVAIVRLARRNWFGSPSWIGPKITPAVAVTRGNSPRKKILYAVGRVIPLGRPGHLFGRIPFEILRNVVRVTPL